ncbi:endospore germination permease [Oscillospiraceae bacterium WX1]
MKAQITAKQIMYASAVIIIATSLMTKHLYTFLGTEAWVAVIIGLLLSALYTAIYAGLSSQFPGASLVEISEAVFGKVIGKIISVLYFYFFITLAALNTNSMGTFIKNFVLQNTPLILIILSFIAVCVWAVRKGPSNMLKYGMLFTVGSTLIILLNLLLLYKVIHYKNFLPVFVKPPVNYLAASHLISLVPLADPFLLFMFQPNMQNPRTFGKALFKGLALGGAVLLIIVFRDIAVLGNMSTTFSFPAYAVVRMIDVGDILTRMDIIYVFTLIALMFFKVSVALYAAVSTLQRLFKFESYQFLVYIMGALLILYADNAFQSMFDHSAWFTSGTAGFQVTFFAVLLPLATVLTALCRGMFKKPQTAGQ